MSGNIHLEGLRGLAVATERDISPPQGSLASEYLPLAVAQLAIMSAATKGEAPETLGVRLKRLEEDQVELDRENFYDQILSDAERLHLPAANVVISLLADHAGRRGGLIN